jgi:hypothetical protein
MMQGGRIGRVELQTLVIIWRQEGRFTLRTLCFVGNNTVLRMLDGWPQCRSACAGAEPKSVPVRNPNPVVRSSHSTDPPNSQLNKDLNISRISCALSKDKAESSRCNTVKSNGC